MQLNLDSPALRGIRSNQVTKTLKNAVTKRKMHKETYEQAWERIFSMKNTKPELERINEVKKAMDEGLIERSPDRENKRFSKVEVMELYTELARRKKERILDDMVENTPDNYVLITDKETLLKVRDELMAEDIIVIDVETTGVDIWSDKIVGHVLSNVTKDVHYYIPTDHDDPTEQLDRELVRDVLKPLYENSNVKKIAHNGKFDIEILHNDLGIKLDGFYWDTQEAMVLLNENETEQGGSYALKALATKYLKDNSYTYGQLFGNVGFNEVPLDRALAYASKDGDITYKLYNFQKHYMKQIGNLYEYFLNVEMPIMAITIAVELRGYEIDLEYAEKIRRRVQERADALNDEVVAELDSYYQQHPEAKDEIINIGSPAQLRQTIEVMTGKDPQTANKNKLKQLSKDYPVFSKLLEYRELDKLISTYYGVLPKKVREQTGRIHTVLKPNGTVTGRFSSGDSGADWAFNIQNQSDESREMFVAPEGKLIVNADFSAQEVRIIASLSKEDVLLDAFAKGVDPYATLASRFYGKPYDQVHKNPDGSDTEERERMKVVLLSSMYGATKYGLSQSLGIDVEEAENFREEFFNSYPKLKAFMEESKEHARRYGFVWIGDRQRKRRLPYARKEREFIPYGKWNDPKYEKAREHNGRISRSIRQATNARIQGMASIQTKITMIEMEKLCQRKGWEIFAPIHDEIVLYVDENLTEEDINDIDRVMTQSYLLDGVENKTDIEVQKRWGQSVMAEDYLKGVELPT